MQEHWNQPDTIIHNVSTLHNDELFISQEKSIRKNKFLSFL